MQLVLITNKTIDIQTYCIYASFYSRYLKNYHLYTCLIPSDSQCPCFHDSLSKVVCDWFYICFFNLWNMEFHSGVTLCFILIYTLGTAIAQDSLPTVNLGYSIHQATFNVWFCQALLKWLNWIATALDWFQSIRLLREQPIFTTSQIYTLRRHLSSPSHAQ